MIKLLLIAFAVMWLCSCTINLQNFTTEGNASDMIDDTQTVSPDIDANLPSLF